MVFFVASAIFILLVVGLLIYAWVANGPAREMRASRARGHVLRPQLIAILQAAPQGVRVVEVARELGQPEEEVRAGFGILVGEGLAHHADVVDEHGRVVARVFWGQPAPRSLEPRAQPQRRAAKPYQPPPQGLPERWLNVRKDIVLSTPLEEVTDIMHPFFVCKRCKATSTAVMMLDGAILGDASTVPLMLQKLSKNPQSLGIARVDACECGGKSTLRRVVLCRTNPTSRNDMHVTVDVNRHDATPRLSFLFLDGRYEHLGDDGYARAFG